MTETHVKKKYENYVSLIHYIGLHSFCTVNEADVVEGS